MTRIEELENYIFRLRAELSDQLDWSTQLMNVDDHEPETVQDWRESKASAKEALAFKFQTKS